MPTKPKTEISTQKLSDVARHVVVPSGIVTTAWPRVVAQCAEMGIHFDGWQHGAGSIALGKRIDGKYAASIGGVVWSIPRQTGKALPLDTPLLTPTGWVTMGSIRSGDKVYGPNGATVEVIFKSEIMHDRDVYRVEFTDGRSLEADADHIWTVRDRRRGKAGRWVDVTTKEMLDSGLRRDVQPRYTSRDGKTREVREFRFQLPHHRPVSLPEVDLPLDPYLLGAWLGDGASRSGRLSTGSEDLAHWVSEIESSEFVPTVNKDRECFTVGITWPFDGRQQMSFPARLRKLGVFGDKHVPEEYLLASVPQRLALLQGLLDTDGHIAALGTVEFSSSIQTLSESVLFLARSLGWKASINRNQTFCHGIRCADRWRVRFKPDLRDGINPFRIPRKAERVSQNSRRTSSVSSITLVKSKPVQCIAVDSPDHLYLAGQDLVPTHNTLVTGMIVIALSILNPGMTVLWTAHRTKTATKAFGSFQGMVGRQKVKPHIAAIRTANGEQEIRFVNGSVIMFGAREQGFGRGFEEVDIEVFDEAQILTDRALSDMVPATNQSRQASGALLFFIGTPPRPIDPGEEFANRRDKAISGKSTDMAYLEFSADNDADPDDVSQWTKANPSFPRRTPLDAMKRMRENLTDDDSFRREALGIWDVKGSNRVIDEESWSAVADPASMAVEKLTLAIDVAPDRSVASIAVAGRRADGLWHVELDEHRKGADWVFGWVEQRASKYKLHSVVVDEISGLVEWRSKRPYLKGTKVGVNLMGAEGRDMAMGCASFYDAVMAAQVRHTDQPQVNVALSVAGKRPIGSGWAWNKRSAESDITPIVALTQAFWGSQNMNATKPVRDWGRGKGGSGWVA